MILRRPILTLFVEPSEEILSAVGRNSFSRRKKFFEPPIKFLRPGQAAIFSWAGNKLFPGWEQIIRPSLATHQAEHGDPSGRASSSTQR